MLETYNKEVLLDAENVKLVASNLSKQSAVVDSSGVDILAGPRERVKEAVIEVVKEQDNLRLS